MGAACCVPARSKESTTQSIKKRNEETPRTDRCSPPWSCGPPNYRRVAGEIENSSLHIGESTSTGVRVEMKDDFSSDRDRDIISDGISPLENLATPVSHKSPPYEGINTNCVSSLETCMASGSSSKLKNNTQAAETSVTPISPQFSIPSSTFSTPGDPLHAHRQLLPPNSTPSRRARRSPGRQLFRQISDNRILGLKSPNSNSLSEGRPSFVLSTLSNDLAGGSSDGWSLRTFSELVASSQRERWSFDSERFGSGRHKIGGSSSRFSCSSPSVDLQTCGACLKILPEFSVIAVLACGHIYHSECLETMTTESEKYDPVCPICTVGQKQVEKMSRKALKAEAELKMKFLKISRNRVVDSYLDSEMDELEHQEVTGKGKMPKMESSSSSRNSFGKPFLKRHFLLGSKRGKSSSENQQDKKKGFWTRYRKD